MFENDLSSQIFSAINSWLKKPFLAIKGLIFCGGLIAILVGLGLLVHQSNQVQAVQDCLTAESSPDDQIVGDNLKLEKITLDIGGAVKKPGLYVLPSGSRYVDLINAAGGLSQEASKEYVAKELNLSKELADQEKVYLPFVDEKVELEQEFTDQIEAISINSASVDALQTLKGVGEVTAQKIIAGRPYSELAQLVSNKILSEKLFSNLKSQLKL